MPVCCSLARSKDKTQKGTFLKSFDKVGAIEGAIELTVRTRGLRMENLFQARKAAENAGDF